MRAMIKLSLYSGTALGGKCAMPVLFASQDRDKPLSLQEREQVRSDTVGYVTHIYM